jgi:hypothetical protein
MSWDEAFASRYDDWADHMTADVAFYVELAREADGPIVELAVGTGRVAIPVAPSSASTRRRRCSSRRGPVPLRQGWTWSCVRAIDVAGLELESLWSGFDHEPLGDDSREYVFVTRRAVE